MEKNLQNKENKILIVDDDKNIRVFLEKYLKQKGHAQVQAVATAKDGLEAVEEGNIGLILLDIRLPDMDGLEALRKIKKINKDIGVIMITAFADEKIAKEAMENGASDYIIKPFDLTYLKTSVINNIIGR